MDPAYVPVPVLTLVRVVLTLVAMVLILVPVVQLWCPGPWSWYGTGPGDGGVGHEILGLDGSSWGKVVSGTADRWNFGNGRHAKKNTWGTMWFWGAQPFVLRRGSKLRCLPTVGVSEMYSAVMHALDAGYVSVCLLP